jgi:hypothetical protein
MPLNGGKISMGKATAVLCAGLLAFVRQSAMGATIETQVGAPVKIATCSAQRVKAANAVQENAGAVIVRSTTKRSIERAAIVIFGITADGTEGVASAVAIGRLMPGASSTPTRFIGGTEHAPIRDFSCAIASVTYGRAIPALNGQTLIVATQEQWNDPDVLKRFDRARDVIDRAHGAIEKPDATPSPQRPYHF